MRDGNIFSLSTLAGGGGYLIPRSGRGNSLFPGQDRGTGVLTTSQVWMGPGQVQGQDGGGGTTIQDRMG